jgi:hypothetical protein
MENIEFKMKAIDNTEFLKNYTKKVIKILKEPILSAEVMEGEPSETVTKVLESLGYVVDPRKYDDKAWVALKGAKKGSK